MTPRERVLTAVDRRMADRTPADYKENWAAWEGSIIEAVDDVDTALLDGTFYSPDELPGRDLSGIGHPFIKASMVLLEKAARKGKTAIYFTHFNHSNQALDPDGDARKSILEKGFQIADEGLEISLERE